MRLLVVSDLHGNWPALEAVAREPHDAVVCLGDVVGYGPEPAACVRWLREERAISVQGNHDRALAKGVAPGCSADFLWLAEATSGIAARQLTPHEVHYLARLPEQRSETLDGISYLLLHATPDDPLYRYLRPDSDGWVEALSGVSSERVLVGHTHTPFDRTFGSVRVVNPGSLGQPKDGDPRASYAVIDSGRVRHGRAAYCVERTLKAYQGLGVDPSAVETLAELLRTGRKPAGGRRPA